MIPNIIYAVKKKNDGNDYHNKAVEIFEQIGRYGCIGKRRYVPCLPDFLGNMLEPQRQTESVIAFRSSVVYLLIQRDRFGKYSAHRVCRSLCGKSHSDKLQKCILILMDPATIFTQSIGNSHDLSYIRQQEQQSRFAHSYTVYERRIFCARNRFACKRVFCYCPHAIGASRSFSLSLDGGRNSSDRGIFNRKRYSLALCDCGVFARR